MRAFSWCLCVFVSSRSFDSHSHSSFGEPRAFRDHFNCPVCGEGCALLPSKKVTAIVTGKIDAVNRFEESSVWTFVVLAAGSGDPCALVVRNLFPHDIHRIVQILSVSGMQSFDGRA